MRQREFVIAKFMPVWEMHAGRWAVWGRKTEWTREIGKAFIYDNNKGHDLFEGEVILTLEEGRLWLALDEI